MKRRYRKQYTPETLREEREYGVFWYSWLWDILRPLLIGICVLCVVVGVCLSLWSWVDGKYLKPVNPQDTADVIFTVESGNSLTRVAGNLETQGLIRNRSVFKYYADFMGFGQKIQVGEYALNRAMTMQEIAQQLTMGDGKPIVTTVTVIPGWTIEDIAAKLYADETIKDKEAFLALCRTGEDYSAYYYIADVLASGTARQRRYVLEGYLAANTYEVYTSASAGDIVKKLLSQTEAAFTAEYHTRAEALDMTMDQVLTLASIIEKEAKNADFAKVSAVFHNRLAKGMALGSDVTVKYASGVSRMALTGQDLAVNSPFNTYLYKGLPPGPICSPSPAAIYAALYPDEEYRADEYLYFCSKDPDTGELYFSRTLQEHEAAVAIYAPLWEAYDAKYNQ